MPDWHGTTGRDDLVGGGGETQYSMKIEGITLCSVEPFTDEEIAALREYFRLLRQKRDPAADRRAKLEARFDQARDAAEFHANYNRPG